MGRARHDANLISTTTGVSSADGETPVEAYVNPNTHRWLVDATGGMTPFDDYDYLDVQQTSATVETYVFKDGGSGGTVIRTIVVTYTDSTKANIDTVTWS